MRIWLCQFERTKGGSGGQRPASDIKMTDILDIEDILVFPLQKWIFFTLILALVLGASLAIWLLVRRWLKRQRLGEERLSPRAKALLEIERLKKQELARKGEVRKFYFFASEILRRYLEEQFAYPALEKTTPEFESDLDSKKILSPPLALDAKSLLEEADQVKFASRRPPLQETDDYLKRLVTIISANTLDA